MDLNTMLLRTNSVLLDTVTLHCLLMITVLIVQLFSLTIATNNIQNRVGHRSKEKNSITKLQKYFHFMIFHCLFSLATLNNFLHL